MTSMRGRRRGIAASVAMLVVLVLSAVSPAADSAADASLLGRFSVVSDAGGAVWSFQPGGGLMVVGPGDLLAGGTWAPGPGPGEFDAELDVAVTGQVLYILGAVSPDGRQVAIYVAASEATSPLDGIPWPPVSRLVGERVGFVADPTASPTPPPADCLRPAWGTAESVDWDRCSVAAQESLPPAG
jgi:hypothetical protein